MEAGRMPGGDPGGMPMKGDFSENSARKTTPSLVESGCFNLHLLLLLQLTIVMSKERPLADAVSS